MSSGPAGSTPSMTRFTPELITAIHSLPDGLGSHLIASGTLDLGKARSRRAVAVADTCGAVGVPNSLNCVCSIGDSSRPTCRTADPPAVGSDGSS